MTIDASSPTLLLANLTTGVTYYIAVAAATKVGVGPFSKPAVLRMDPRTQSLDTGYTRYPINRDIADDFLTQTWFIVLLGSIIAIIVFLFGALVLFKRYQFIKQTSLGSLHGNHAIGAVRKFPTLPLNANGVWIDPTGGVWRQANSTSCTTKEQLPDYAQVTGQTSSSSSSQQHHQHNQAANMPLPDYERLTPLNMPDYAEVACSTFKNPNGNALLQQQTANNADRQQQQKQQLLQQQQSLYDSCGAYATTNLVANAKLYQNRSGAGGGGGSGSGNNATTSPAIKTQPKGASDILDGLRAGNEQKLSQSSATSTRSTHNNDDYRSTMSSLSSGMYSAPPSNHYSMGLGMDNNAFGSNMLTLPDKMTASTASTAILTASPAKSQHAPKKATSSVGQSGGAAANKINITENRFDLMMSNEPLQPTRLNPFNSNSMQSQSQRQQQQQQQLMQQQQQQLLVASNALKQGLGAYANTTLATQMINGGGAGTLRRPRNPKMFKSENNINFGSLYNNKSPQAANGTGTTNTPHNTGSHLDFLTNSQTDHFNDSDFTAISNSTNQLLNDWASNSSIAASDYHFGSKQPNKQHLYIKSKDGTWSAVSSDAYQAFRQQQLMQQPPPSYAHAAGDKLLQPSPSHHSNTNSSSTTNNTTPSSSSSSASNNTHHSNSSTQNTSTTNNHNTNNITIPNNSNTITNTNTNTNSNSNSSSSSSNLNSTASDNLLNSNHNNKYFSSFGPSANV